jgi:hypothetical protein
MQLSTQKDGGTMRVLLGILMLGLTGVSYPQTSKQPFTITISTDKPEVKSGDGVYIDVVMKNTSDHDVDCAINGQNALDRNYQYEVLDDDGKALPKIVRSHHVPGNLFPCIIKPGETSSSGGLISILYDFTRPGKYTIQVSRPVWGDDQRPEKVGKVHPGSAGIHSVDI